LSYGKVHAEPGDFNFSIIGTSIAVWDDFDAGPTRPEVSSTLDDPTLLFNGATEGEFGVGANIVDDRLYLFSCSGGPSDSRGCRLAGAQLDASFRRDAWEFRTDDGWSSHVGDAVDLFDGSPNMTVHHSGFLDRWVAVYLDFGTIVLRTAPAIEGPWSDTLE